MQSEVGQAMAFDWSNGLILIDHLALLLVSASPRTSRGSGTQKQCRPDDIITITYKKLIFITIYLWWSNCNLLWKISTHELSRMSILLQNLWRNHNNNNNREWVWGWWKKKGWNWAIKHFIFIRMNCHESSLNPNPRWILTSSWASAE